VLAVLSALIVYPVCFAGELTMGKHYYYYYKRIYLNIFYCTQPIDEFGSLAGPMALAGAQLYSYLALWFCCSATRNPRRSTIRREKLYMKTKCAP